jgi:hypothetical protein
VSRSNTGKKGPGYEHWSRRANGSGKWLREPGRMDKTLMHRRERRTAGPNQKLPQE